MLSKIFSAILFVLILIPLVQAQITDISLNPTSAEVEILQNDFNSFDITFTNSNPTEDIELKFSYDTIEDNKGDEIILNFPSSFIVPSSSSKTLQVNIKADENIDLDKYITTIIIAKSDGNETSSSSPPTETINFPLTILTVPGICDFGQVGSDLKINVKDPDSGDNYSPGDTITIRVEVENIGNDNIDVQVEAFLFDEDNVIESSSSKRENVEDSEKKTFEFTLNIPESNNDINEDENYKLFIKAFDDDHENQNCVQESLDIDIELEKHKVIIKDTSRFSSPVVACNTQVTAVINIINIGKTDEDVKISIENKELNINQISDIFEIQSFGADEDNEASRSFKINIPDNIAEGTYNFLAEVMFGGKTESKIIPLEIISCGQVFENSNYDFTSASLYIKGNRIIDLKPKSSTTIHALIENNAPNSQILFIKLKNVDQFGEGSSTTITIPAFQASNVFLPLNIHPEVEEGMYTATVELSNGYEVLSSDTVTINIASENQGNLIESSTEGFSSAGLVILNIIILFIIIAVVLLLKRI